MSPRTVRSQACDRVQAQVRLEHAVKALEVAELVASETSIAASRSIAAAVAVLAGIAASDAACCAAFARRSRAQDHRDAAELLREIREGGVEAAKDLLELLDLKDTAHYGLIYVTATELKRALRRAGDLTEFAKATLLRTG